MTEWLVRRTRPASVAPVERIRQPGHHRRTQCAGCGEWVVRARCRDGENRFFDEDPVKIDNPDEPFQEPGPTNSAVATARALESKRIRLANAQLWVFDPSWNMAMVRYTEGLLVDRGLKPHFCTLGQQNDPGWWGQGDVVRWTPYMNRGDFTDET